MGKSNFLQEFKTFAMKGNVIDLAVGVIIGGAFNKIVSSVVADLIMPLVGILIGGVNFTDLKITLKHAEVAANGVEYSPAVTLNYGNFIQSALDFLIIAFSIFIFVKVINRLTHLREQENSATPPEPTKEEELLTEIRDLLKEKNSVS